jgi:hypothetical protein
MTGTKRHNSGTCAGLYRHGTAHTSKRCAGVPSDRAAKGEF